MTERVVKEAIFTKQMAKKHEKNPVFDLKSNDKIVDPCVSNVDVRQMTFYDASILLTYLQ